MWADRAFAHDLRRGRPGRLILWWLIWFAPPFAAAIWTGATKIGGSLDLIAEAVLEAGTRACLCYEVTDRDGPEAMQAGIRENVRLLRAAHQRHQAGDWSLAATFGLPAGPSLGFNLTSYLERE